MTRVLVINAGSSSIKYQLIAADTGERFASGLVERIGAERGRIVHKNSAGEAQEAEVIVPDHAAGFSEMLQAFDRAGEHLGHGDIAAVGHRVVQGGAEFAAPTLIDDDVAQRILALGELAPLHNPGEYQAIQAARKIFTGVPHVAVFDTAFHQTIPPAAHRYAIAETVAIEHGVRRYGFHGTSHQVVSRRAAEYLGKPLTELKQIVLHLGNGASLCAIDGGKSVETSMGFTPLEGLVMGTRSGDIDPAALLHLLRRGYTVDELDKLLNQRSGLLGMAGANDMRDVRAAAAQGDANAQLAIDVYVHRIRRYLGAYILQLGGVDAISFTAGVGENVAELRAQVLAGTEFLGIKLDSAANEKAAGTSLISTPDSAVAVLVVPTDEEAEIARLTMELVS